MLGLRFLVVLFALLCGGSLLAWVLTGDRRYGRLAWTIAKVIGVALFCVLALMALERVLVL